MTGNNPAEEASVVDGTLGDLMEGDRLPTLEKDLQHEQLFRYSAMTWNAHRIHYDPEYARSEGHPGALVQQHFHGAVIQQLIEGWVGTEGRFASLAWDNVGRATPEDTLYVEAEVAAVEEEGRRIEFDVWTATDEERCAEGSVTIVVEE
jgi:hydroxyacyl-ACP dehydratase HTD2-like protein with hotdog domain